MRSWRVANFFTVWRFQFIKKPFWQRLGRELYGTSASLEKGNAAASRVGQPEEFFWLST
ncbi:hypothetical protein K9N68_23205 [Kovacikia minuta CCNUW1]|uniref:hypothetical protein n=1 Tax=Kovacikia minuta TaxID=2931930 RepID=UPI001CCEC7E5|nr:hypothetical protein [Kovacikia minuta]UBF24573.1 hypothetical protein K9N68_23205 [Kovacikia minuta CCNUW1]